MQTRKPILMRFADAARSRARAVGLVACALLGTTSLPAAATTDSFTLGTAFTYQGRLQEQGRAATGRYDVRFELFDAFEGGAVRAVVERTAVEVRNGTFLAELDFSVDVFAGEPPYVQLHVRRTGEEAASFTELRPRQRLAGVGGLCTIDENVQINGEVTVNPPASETDLSVTCCNDVDSGGQLSLTGGLANALNFDSNEVQATVLGQPGGLDLNASGGGVGVGVEATSAPLTLPAGPDVSPGSGGALLIGSTDDLNIALDNNEIMARDGGAVSTLFVNPGGGEVHVGGNVDVDVELNIIASNVATVNAACLVGRTILSGGCRSDSEETTASFPPNSSSWRCQFTGSNPSNTAYSICARMVAP